MHGQQNINYTLSITDRWSGIAHTARCIISSAEAKHGNYDVVFAINFLTNFN